MLRVIVFVDIRLLPAFSLWGHTYTYLFFLTSFLIGYQTEFSLIGISDILMLLCVIPSGPSYMVFQLSWWYKDWFSGLSQWRSGTISFTLLSWLSLLLTVVSHVSSDKFSLKPKGKYFESFELSLCFLIVSSWSCRFFWSFLNARSIASTQ